MKGFIKGANVPFINDRPTFEAVAELKRTVHAHDSESFSIQDRLAKGPTALLWDDVFGDISQGAGVAALTYQAYRDTSFMMYFMQHNQPDALFFRYQFPHRWNKKQVRPHLHFLPMAAGAGRFAVIGHYVWVSVDRLVPAIAGWTAYSAYMDLVAGDQYREKILTLAKCDPPENSKESDILLIRCVRDHAGADTYTTSKDHGTAAANIGLLSMDAHYQSEKSGTVQEY
jgi:hypothetical protein